MAASLHGLGHALHAAMMGNAIFACSNSPDTRLGKLQELLNGCTCATAHCSTKRPVLPGLPGPSPSLKLWLPTMGAVLAQAQYIHCVDIDTRHGLQVRPKHLHLLLRRKSSWVCRPILVAFSGKNKIATMHQLSGSVFNTMETLRVGLQTSCNFPPTHYVWPSWWKRHVQHAQHAQQARAASTGIWWREFSASFCQL